MSTSVLRSIPRARADEHPQPTRQREPALRRWDALLVGLAGAHGLLLCWMPLLPVVALGLWWNSNTIAHYAIHRPMFRSAGLNRAFALYLSMLLGIPQTIWRERHMAHHAGMAWRPKWSLQCGLEIIAVLAVWTALAWTAPGFFLAAYLPGWAIGLCLCGIHGHFEHHRGTISHYGSVYNLLFFNDGYHAEHHRRPSLHWTELPQTKVLRANTSRWPAVLRWLDFLSLESLERMVLRSPLLQRLVVSAHERAAARLLTALPPVRSVAIIGGGLFPRTAIVLRRLLPAARLVVIDKSPENLAAAPRFLDGQIEIIEAWYDPELHQGFDLVVIPLSFQGDRQQLYDAPPAPAMLVHDWLWRPRGRSAVVSWLLLKRMNLVLA